MFAFQLCDSWQVMQSCTPGMARRRAGGMALHTQRKARGTRPAFWHGQPDMALAFFFNALLYEIHCISISGSPALRSGLLQQSHAAVLRFDVV